MLDDNDIVVEAFTSRAQPLDELLKALKTAANDLSGAHFGMRIEFGRGW